MTRSAFFLSAALFLSLSLCCEAQQVVPSIELSAAESADGRHGAEELRKAQDRATKADNAWQDFVRMYRDAHPEMPVFRFTSDFRLAFPIQSGLSLTVQTVSAIRLTAGEQRKAQVLYQERVESREAFERQIKDWRDYENQVLADHVKSTGLGSNVTLRSGKLFAIPPPWNGGIAFTPDFHFVVPR